MDSRFNFGDAYSVPRGEEFRSVGSWVPATPQKHVPASPLWPPAHVHENQLDRMRWPEMGRLPAGYAQDMPNYSAEHIHENQLDRMSWPEMGGLPARYTQDMPNYTAEAHHLGLGQIQQVGAPCGYYVGNAGLTEKNRLINHIAGSYTHAVFNGSDSRNSNSLATLLGLKNSVPTSSTTRRLDTSIRHSSLILNSVPQASNSRESNLGEVPLANQSSCSSSDLLSRHNNLSQSPQYGFPVPYHPNYDQADAASSLTTRQQYKPVAPEQVMMLKHEQFLPMVNLSQEASSSKEKEKQPDSFISLENEAGFPVPYHPNYDQADAGSSLTTRHQYKPAAPEQDMMLKHEQLLPMVHLSQEASSSEEKEKQPGSFISLENEANQQISNELLHSILDLSSAVLSTPIEEPKDSDRLSDQGIDLNKTPQQKPPKRKKHRPKVIVEGKPQKNKKAASANVTNLKETPAGKRKYVRKQGLSEPNLEKEVKPTGKRKYVRKKGLEESATQHVESNGKTSYSAPTTAAKSSRRALNFDLENSEPGRAGNSFAQPVEILNGKEMACNLRMGSQAVEPSNRAKMIIRTNSTLEISQKIGIPVDEQKLAATTNLAHSMTEMTTDYPSIPERRVAAAQLAATNDKQTASLHISMDTRIQNEGIHQLVFPTVNSESLEKTTELMFQSTPQSVPKCSSYLIEGRRSKRDYQHIEQTSHHGSNQTSPEIFLWGNIPQRSIMLGADSSETRKKRKTDSVSQTNPFSMASWFGATNGSRQMTKHMDDFNSSGSTPQRNHEIIDSYCENVNISRRESGWVDRSTTDRGTHSMASRHSAMQYIFSEPHQCMERMKETNRLAQVNNFCSSTANQKDNIAPATPCLKGTAPGDQQQLKTCNIDNLKKQQTVEPTLSTSAPSLKSKMPEAQKVLNNRQQSSAKRRGRPAKQKLPSIGEITNQIEGLNLLERSSRIEGKDQYAIVPYKGDGAVVPYEMKRHKPRPKVDLDAETERVWRLLMGKDSCENLEAKDKEKEKWWEEERRVFHGRADSFIARMHLVQGDRRFSKWKGSVVDSVVGVFLTQNVSDHLSSSAFMSLAARFPIKLFGHPLCSQNSVTTKESMEHQRYCRTSWIDRTTMLPAHSLSPEEEVLSSQDSIDSSVIQADGGVRSYTGSNSETEDPGMGCKPHKNHDSFSTDLQFENTTSFEEFYTRISGTLLFHTGSRHVPEQPEDRQSGQLKSGLEKLDNVKGSSTLSLDMNHRTPCMQIQIVPSGNDQLLMRAQPMLLEGFESHTEESTSYWPSTAPRFKEKDAIYIGKTVGQNAANSSTVKTTTQRYAVSSYQGTPVVGPDSLLSKKSMPEKSNSQLCHDIQLHQTNESFQLKGTSSVILDEAQAKGQKSYPQHISNIPKLSEKGFDDRERVNLVDKQKQSKTQLAEPNSTKLVHPTNTAQINAHTKTARKGKAGGENKDTVDWDSLRKEALEKTRRKERSEDTVDSLDYKALRRASVQEISEAIKERGMNNMLAERIKEFLDRLVTEHGSIDLEWLRNVPPEKAKDYLLSIRGLGLKSVECVRLLTLHHVAFPVDTNVGRIAVRLGWVPLQPLPESLQIHLLELYPVLESIQKYLWPRLCTLDQQTLYELHYQLITFGKVFCTKKSPNCNACPMRAECRHFASAFASARLALPAPEEKSKVTFTVSNIDEANPGININPMPLPQSEIKSLERAGSNTGSCVPIVEEPKTPEQEYPRVVEGDIEDIEDMFNEDPEEIPTIKLNMEEFTVTLQNYVQEGDMSKALVAINSEAASLPAPKLKNVSRLRTEHQVYELPDSHPLLQGMDRREPDDPSPYLLAIWRPGETPDSVEVPDCQCQSQEPNKLCNEKTCFSCNSIRETNSNIVRGTILIPCRTAMRGSFPLNGTYFQVNEVFADHESSINPIDVPRAWIWNLPRRIVYFGTSVSTIFKGLSTQGIQYCFWKGFVCVRGFDQKTRAPRPLTLRLHFPASKLVKTKTERK